MNDIESWRSSGEFLAWRGHRVFVRARGEGPPLLLVHGFPTASYDWHAVEPALARQHRVIAFDLLGFGWSDKPAGHDYRIAGQADLAEAVLAHFGIREASVLAHDYGDTVAQELLARQREGRASWRLTRLGLLNGGLFPETHRPLPVQRLLASPIGGLVARMMRYPQFARSMQRICCRPLAETDLRALWQLIEYHDGRAAIPRLIRYMAERRVHRERWVGALVDPPVPVRLVNGSADPISGAHMVARYRELVPDADVVALPGIGHYPQLEAPEAVVAAWLDHS